MIQSKYISKLGRITLASSILLIGLLHAETVSKSIAVINGEAIYMSEFENNLAALQEQRERSNMDPKLAGEWEKETKKALLDQMVEEKLLLQEAKKRNIKVPKRQLEEGVQQVKNRFKILAPGAKPTKEDYERALLPAENAEFLKELKGQGLTEKDFEAKIDDQLKSMRLTEDEVRSRVPEPFTENKNAKEGEDERLVTPQYEKEAKTLYDEIEKKFNQKEFKPDPTNDIDVMVNTLKSKLGESVRANHLLIKSSRTDDLKKRTEALNRIKAIKKEVDGGTDFVDLVKAKSEAPGAKTGGDLGFFTRGQMVPEFEKAAFALSLGGVSDVIETEFGYHLLQVTEKKAARKLKYDDIKADLAGYLYQKRSQERYEEFVNELKKKAEIKILVDVNSIKDAGKKVQ